jgi:malate synthase
MRVEVLVDRSEFGELLGEKLVNGRKLVVEEVIGELTVELRPAIDAAVSRRRKMLEDRRPVAVEVPQMG